MKYRIATASVRMRQQVPEFDGKLVNIEEWLDLFEMTASLNGIAADEVKRSYLLSQIGIEAYSVVCKLAAPTKP